jgi:hypothetical protein
VFPDLVTPGPTAAAAPDELGSIREARLRCTSGGAPFWTVDLIDPATRTHRVESITGEDVTEGMLGAPASGDAYLYELEGKRPTLPYALYHAGTTGRLWDPYEAIEIVDGTLDVGVLWSFWHHAVRDASWPQRYAAGFAVAGGSQVGEGTAARTEVVMDPAILAILTPLSDSGTGVIGQWGAAVDVHELAEAILTYERRLPAYMGLSPSDFARVSGDPRSGYALMISRDGQREAARRLEPQFRRGDLRLLMLCAAALNRWWERHGLPMRLPETGWRLRYRAIPASPEEQRSQREHVTDMLDRGLMTKAQAYAALHGVTDEEAVIATTAEEDADQRAPLNGAQAQVVFDTIERVAAGRIPRDAAVAALAEAIAIDTKRADRLLGTAGRGFKPAAPAQGG